MTKANIFVIASWLGLAGVVLMVAAALFPSVLGLEMVGILIVFISSVALLITRNTDEYTNGLWSAGASLAFASLLLLLVIIPFGEGLYDGFQGSASEQDTDPYVVVAIAIGAFYVGFLRKRARGGI